MTPARSGFKGKRKYQVHARTGVRGAHRYRADRVRVRHPELGA
jgi:hypothetical protein